MKHLIDEIWPEHGIKTIIDVGAGDCWFTDHLTRDTEAESHVAVDLHEPSLERARAKNIPGLQTFNMDIREYLRLRAEAAVDAVVAIDVIEHFDEDQARWLIGEIDRVAKHLAIIFTTNGYIEQGPFDNNGEPNQYQEHFYGPTAEDFSNGWTVNVHPEYHGARGGAIFAYKFVEPIPPVERL